MRTFTTLVLAVVLGSGPAFAQGGFLGIALDDSGPGQSGAVIASVETRSAASIMGLRTGDRVIRVDEVAVADAAALAALIGERLPGEIVELRVVRGDAELDLLGVLGRRPGAAAFRASPRMEPPPHDGEGMERGEWRFETFEMPELDFAIPELRFDMPPMRMRGFEMGDFSAQMEQLQRQMDELRARHAEMMRGFESRLLREPRAEGDRQGPVRERVHLRYPEATPEAERERLRAEAREKYGPEAEVEFAGQGTSITIERTLTGSAAPAPPDSGSGNREF
jgi:hypothetical protein